MDYRGDLILAVGVLGDPRAIPGLAGAIDTGGDATEPLASFGGAALPCVLSKLHSPRLLTRSDAVVVLVAMLKPMNKPLLSAEDLSTVSGALRTAAIDEFAGYLWRTETAAIAGLEALHGRADCRALGTARDRSRFAQVRQAASLALVRLGSECQP